MSTHSQTVGRAVQLLRLIASSKTRKLRLIDIAEMASLDKSTVHRLLQRLVHERMLIRDPGQRGYRLGPLLYELGLAALPETDLRQVSDPSLRELARATGDMTFLIVRSGFDTVCLNRILGDFKIQTLTREVGDRHPLGIGAGGLALLASLSERESQSIIDAITPQLPRYQLTENTLRERVDITRKQGFALDEGRAALDVTALGRAIKGPRGAPVGAVFVASICARMNKHRQALVDRHLVTCIQHIETALA